MTEADLSFYVATAIFVITYLLIIFDVLHQTIASLIGAVAMVLAGIYFGFLTWEDAVHAIDFEVIGLLLGMMIIVSIIAHTGAFQWISIKILKKSGGNLFLIMILFAMLTAFASMILDNVTTVLLTTPPLIEVAYLMKINPVPILIVIALASNVGGTATLVGDPPNILIAAHADLSFTDFILYEGKPTMFPLVVFVLILSIPYFYFITREYISKNRFNKKILDELSEDNLIKDKGLLMKSLFVLAVLILMFIFQKKLGLNIAMIALSGAALLLILVGRKKFTIDEVLEHVEWPTLLFFAFLFVVVKGAENVGLIDRLAMFIASFIEGDTLIAITLIVWFIAILSAFVNNIPLTAAMLPLIDTISKTTGIDALPLFWALSLGACFGGNGTIIGASANVVVAGIAERVGYPIRSIEFMKYGLPYMIFSTFLGYIFLIFFWGL